MTNTFFYRLLKVFLRTYLTNDYHSVLGSQMNFPLSIHVKGSSSPLTNKMIIIIIVAYAATSFFAPNIGAKAYAQEDSNSNNSSNTLILEDLRAIMRDQQRDIASIRN